MAPFTSPSKRLFNLSALPITPHTRAFTRSALLSERKTYYPLYPSVAALLKTHDIPPAIASKIRATGPNGRLLKGDVLAYLGTIPSSYSAEQSARIQQLGHLDLSNIKVATPSPAPSSAPKDAQKAAARAPEPPTEATIPISLRAVLDVQKRIQTSLGITLPLSTFISRASELANRDLPYPPTLQPTPDQLFDQILGLDSVPKTARGSFTPQIVALPPKSSVERDEDIIDILTTRRTPSIPGSAQASSLGILAGAEARGDVNLLRVSVPAGEEKRARVFLERVKTTLQIEPGRLVL